MKNNILKFREFFNSSNKNTDSNIIEVAKAYKEAFDSYKINGDKYYYTKKNKDSIAQIYRYIKILNLIQEMQDLVIEKKISISVAVILSDFSTINQKLIYTFFIENPKTKITIKKVKLLKDYQDKGILSDGILNKVLNNTFAGKLKKETITKLSAIFCNDEEYNEFIENFIKIKM